MHIDSILGDSFSGVVSIVQNGESVFQKAYGFADRANKIPNELDTKFETASAGKVFVATAILQLIEAGTLTFDSVIGDMLDFDLQAIDPQITIRQLLNHTSGIPDYFDESVMHNYEELWRDIPNYRIRASSDLIPLFIDKPMMYARGGRFQYNNTGYVVLGLVIEAMTHLPFDTFLEQSVFHPCGMADTGYYELDRLPAKCAHSYIRDDKQTGESPDCGYRTNIYSIDAKGSGAGGAFTTTVDVEKFWDKLTGYGLIGKDLLALMLAPQVPERCYGYGVWLLESGLPSFQGCDPGANFITSYDVVQQRSITLISNMDVDVKPLHDKILGEVNQANGPTGNHVHIRRFPE